MENEDIIQLAREMRIAQKDYFATRSRIDLQRRKSLEKQVDQALEEWTKNNPKLLIDLFL